MLSFYFHAPDGSPFIVWASTVSESLAIANSIQPGSEFLGIHAR